MRKKQGSPQSSFRWEPENWIKLSPHPNFGINPNREGEPEKQLRCLDSHPFFKLIRFIISKPRVLKATAVKKLEKVSSLQSPKEMKKGKSLSRGGKNLKRT